MTMSGGQQENTQEPRESHDNLVMAKSGMPFTTKHAAMLALEKRKDLSGDYEPVQLKEGEWALMPIADHKDVKSMEPEQDGKAPAFLGQAEDENARPVPRESRDVSALLNQEQIVEEAVHTLDVALVPDPDGKRTIDFVTGKDRQTGILMTTKVPAKEIKIPPHEVIQYLGSVIEDRQSVHSSSCVVRKVRHGAIFDRFFVHNGQKLSRCCWIPNPIVRAGILYEKLIDRRTRQGFASLKKLPGDKSGPAYRIVGATSSSREADYRDLKRIFERTWIKAHQKDELLATEIGLPPLV